MSQFRERLGFFSFFHLGSDAQISLQAVAEGLKVGIAHARVTPFEFTVPWALLESLAGDAERFESFMLEYLGRYRRS